MDAPFPSAERVVEALGVPEACRLAQRIPKKLLLEHGSATAADKRLITDAVDEIRWVAALKPNQIGIPEYRDTVREYLEIAVLTVALRQRDDGTTPFTKTPRLAELLHRAIPYPLFLIVQGDGCTSLSLAHKRWAQNEAGKMVLEGEDAFVTLTRTTPAPEILEDFLRQLSLSRQPRESLFTVYQGWMDGLVALQAAALTGRYALPKREDRASRREALQETDRLAREVTRLQALAAKEKQMARRVELNLELRALQVRQAELMAQL